MKLFKDLRLGIKVLAGYVRSNRKAFFLGLAASVTFLMLLPVLTPYLIKKPPRSVGMVGNFTLSTLPRPIQEEISFGLVKLMADGGATAGAALSWTATDSGRKFVFNLNPGLKWQDGGQLTAANINYNLKGVDISRPDDRTIEFVLKEPFAPLVNLLSQPIFKTGLVGLGNYRVVNVSLNGRFLSALILQNLTTRETKIYKFYASEKDLVTAMKLGAVREATGLHDPLGLAADRRYRVTEETATDVEAILFFNTAKKPFDDKTLRQSLVYALPEQSDSPFPRNHWAQTDSTKKYPLNPDLARKGIDKVASGSGDLKLTLTTGQGLTNSAREIAEAWKTVGVKAEVQVSEVLPLNFDAYLTFIDLPSDPDQYLLWHSTQTGNISGYKSFKVDKLLEEGRRTIDQEARKEIYANFARAITEDVPAVFLFYPKIYTVTRS